MIAKVILNTMQNARKLVNIVERIPYDVELCSGRYVVNAKSMLGVLSMPKFESGELHVHTDDEIECSRILEQLLENELLADTCDAAKKSLYDITTFGEILIDFTWQGVNESGDGERSFSFARKPGADTRIEKEEVNVDILDNTKVFHVGSLSLTHQPARDTTLYAIRRAKEKGSIISYDPNYRASLWKDEKTAKSQMRSLIPYVDIMKISDEETELLTGKVSPEEAAETLFQKGVQIAIVTLGSEGAYLYCSEGGAQIPGFVSKVMDTNGAGDSFWGGFLYCISKADKSLEQFTMDELKEYVRFGNAVASLCVEKKGAIPAMPTLAEVKERMER